MTLEVVCKTVGASEFYVDTTLKVIGVPVKKYLGKNELDFFTYDILGIESFLRIKFNWL